MGWVMGGDGVSEGGDGVGVVGDGVSGGVSEWRVVMG